MAEYLSNLGVVISSMVDYVDDVIAIFTGNPVLFTFLGIAVLGTLIGIVRSLVRGA